MPDWFIDFLNGQVSQRVGRECTSKKAGNVIVLWWSAALGSVGKRLFPEKA